MKSIVRILATLGLILTCFLGPVAVAQSTNAPASVRVNQRYSHGEGAVTYYLVFAQTKESATEGAYSGTDMESWGIRILDALDKEFGGKIFKLKVPEHPTPKEKKIKEKEFLPRAVAEADKWLKEQGLAKNIQLINLDFDLITAGTTPGNKDSKGQNVSASGVTIGR